MTKVSIILPIYNVEKYLKRCVDSILNQTLQDIEIILATDGPEACDKICEDYANKDPRIKVVMHPGSYGKAFNKSLEIAAGEYIGIVETDDWCDKTMFEKLYKKAIENNADVVKCGFWFAFNDESKNYTVLHNQFNENMEISKCPEFLSTQPSVWSCIYKKDFLIKNNIDMIEKRMSFIDSPFHYETLIKAKNYILLKEPLYYYYQENENQTVQNVKSLDGLNSEIYAYEKIKNSEIWDTVKEGYIFSTALHLQWNFERLKNKDKNLFWRTAHKYVVNLNLDGVSYFYFDKNLKKLFFEIKKHKSYSSMKKYYLFKNLIGIIFSVKNDYIHKVVTICAIKIKFKNKKLIKRHGVDKNSFLEDIFSVKNNDIRKIITILGIKFKFKNYKKQLKIREAEVNNKNIIIHNLTNEVESKHATIQNLTNEIENKNSEILNLKSKVDMQQEFKEKFINFLDNNKNDLDICDYRKNIITDNNIELYNDEFYKINAQESYDSAMKIINIFKKYYKPKSVLDLGCGVGTWLKAWNDNGAERILGFDANEMPEEYLYIPRENLQVLDFEKEQLKLNERFDLAMSLECLEHISIDNQQKALNVLTNASDMILFSAAIPYQVGTNHINCHKLTFWTDLFKNNGYNCYDIIRPECIKNSLKVGAWYIQNILVYAKNDKARILEENGAKAIEKPIMFYHQKILQDILIVNK